MKAFVSLITVTLVILLTPALAAGQGVLRGTVVDSVSGEPLIGANIHLVGTGLGGVTDREGIYRISGIPAGAYRVRISYIGYRAKDGEVTIGDGATAVLDLRLVVDVLENEEVVVTAQLRGQVAAINQQITSNTIVNVISEEKIQELPDANAAEAIGRLPGVSVLRSGGEANKVVLRGLSDKYTTITVDGIRIAPTDADERGVDLSTVAQGSLAGVELYKALTPDKDADALGGTINLVTPRAPEERLLRVDAKGEYNDLMSSFAQYDFGVRYGERFFDDVFGLQVNGNIERRNRSNERFNLDYNQNLRGGQDYEISNFLVEFTDEIRERYGASLLLDAATPEGGVVRLNTIYNRTDRAYLHSTRNYPYGTGLLVSYNGREREQEIQTFTNSLHGENYLWGFRQTWGVSFAQSRGEFPYDYAINFIEPSILEGNTPVSGMKSGMPSLKTEPERLIPYALNNYQAAYLENAYYRGEKNLDKERTAYLDLAANYVLGGPVSGEMKIGGKYRTKNRSKSTSELYSPYYLGYWRDFTLNPDGSRVRKNFTGTWFEPFYQRFQIDASARNPFALDFLDPTPGSRDLYDQYTLSPIVNRDALREWYALNKNGVDTLGRNYEYYDNPAVQADYYDIVERVGSLYLMNTLTIGPALTFIAGIRMETENNDYVSKFSPSGLGGFPIPSGGIRDTSATYTETVWLPNFHLTVRPTDFMHVRLAAYRALSRPDFNMRLEKYVSQGGGGSVSLLLGNSALKTAKAWNYEVNTSFYGNDFGLISASAFYKEIDDLYHELRNAYTVGNEILDMLGIGWRTPHTGSYALTVPYNSTQPTNVWGFEFEHQMNFNFLPGLWKNLVLSYNGTFVGSETTILATDTFTVYIKQPTGFPPPFDSLLVPITNNKLVEKQQKLEGQPRFYANVAIGYDIGGLSARLSLFYQAEYNYSFSASGLSDQVIDPYLRLDLALKYKFSDHVSVMFSVSNLTEVDESNSIINRSTGWKLLNTSERYGRTADLGIRVSL